MKNICNKKVLVYNKKYDNAVYLYIRKNKTLAFRVRSLRLLQNFAVNQVCVLKHRVTFSLFVSRVLVLPKCRESLAR